MSCQRGALIHSTVNRTCRTAEMRSGPLRSWGRRVGLWIWSVNGRRVCCPSGSVCSVVGLPTPWVIVGPGSDVLHVRCWSDGVLMQGLNLVLSEQRLYGPVWILLLNLYLNSKNTEVTLISSDVEFTNDTYREITNSNIKNNDILKHSGQTTTV